MWPFQPGLSPEAMRQMLQQQRKMIDEMEEWLQKSMSQTAAPLLPAHPPMLHDNGDHWLFRAHLPGFDKGSVKTTHRDGWMQLEVKANTQQELQSPNVWQFSQLHGQWRHAFPVPPGTEATGVKHTWNGDLLELKFPKRK